MSILAIIAGSAPVAALFAVGVVARHRSLRVDPTPADWTLAELVAVADPPDPLTREVSEVELAEAVLFNEVAASLPVRLDWAPPSFTSEWRILGDLAAQLGDTQPLAAVAA